jgi:maleate cis-trans isomerase
MAQFWFDTAPEGVEIMTTPIGYRDTQEDEFRSGYDRAADVARTLADAGASIVVMAGTPPALLSGPEPERAWARDLAEELGVPVVPPMFPHVCALQALGLQHVVVASYYRAALNEHLRTYVKSFGLTPLLRDAAGNLSANEEEAGGLQQLGHRQIQQITFEEVYTYCKDLVSSEQGPVDGVYINGSGWDALPATVYLEEDLEIPVVVAQAAVLWYTYRLLRIRCHAEGAGRLMSAWPALPAHI